MGSLEDLKGALEHKLNITDGFLGGTRLKRGAPNPVSHTACSSMMLHISSHCRLL